MPAKRVLLHGRRRVAERFPKTELDRFLAEAVAEAERLTTWAPGEEHVYLIEDEADALDGIESSALTVCHMGRRYEVYFYDGVTGETYR